jgi:hypothetical protein
MTQPILGFSATANDSEALHRLGTRHVDQTNGKEYIYLKADAGGVTGAGYAVGYEPDDFVADMLDTTMSATAIGLPVAIASAAVTASYYFWGQIYGPASIRVAASAAKGVRLNTTGTAGQLDDDGTASAEPVVGLALTTANGGSAATAAGSLAYPTLGQTL